VPSKGPAAACTTRLLYINYTRQLYAVTVPLDGRKSIHSARAARARGFP
jgi:hypothetical protein